MKEKLKNLFIYSGLTKEQYKQIEHNLQEDNRSILMKMSPVAGFLFFALVVAAFFNETMMSRMGLYAGSCLGEVIIFILARSAAKQNVKLTIVLVHLFNFILYGFGFVMDIVSRQNNPAVAFCIIIVICQLVFTIKPIQTSIVSFGVMSSFLIISFNVKSPDAFLDDILNLTCFWFAAMTLNIMLSNVRVKSHLSVIEQIEQSEELAKALKTADEANSAKSTFLFNMSHDIRTPMNAIVGYTNLLNQTISQEDLKSKKYIENIKISSKYLLDLLDNVLEMSSIESGKTELQLEPYDMVSFMESLRVIFEEDMNKKKLTFLTKYDMKYPYVYIDTVKVREIALNIISNSVKYTPDGGHISLEVNDTLTPDPNIVIHRVIITDDGIGIGEEFLPHLFEPFSRERNTTKSNIAGTGLGMGIVKKLVDLMGGNIRVESKVGKGTKTILELPLKIASYSDITSVNKNNSEGIEDQLKNKNILLAEDNDMNAEIAIEVLQQQGFNVERATDGKVCIDMLERQPAGTFDVILMDIQMPNMNGYETTRLIRKMSDTGKSNIPIIAMTANAFTDDKKNAFESGMNAYITKPFDVSLLLEKISEISAI